MGMRRYGGPGMHGVGGLPLIREGGVLGSPPLDFDFDTFTAGMAKRAAPGPFAAAPIVQGNWDASGTPDVLSLGRGSLFGNPTQYTYDNFDPVQGEAVLWWTPEMDSGSGPTTAYVWYVSAAYYLAYNYTTGTFTLCIGTQTMTRAQAATAGTDILVTAGWDTKNTLDGTNYARLGTNDTFTFGTSTQPTVSAPAATMYIGSNGTASPINAINEGVTWFRRPLYDGAYGVPMTFDASGPVDELAAIYAAGAGQDATLVTGSWDCCFCLPTDSTEGALA